jgi:hypothetical protein
MRRKRLLLLLGALLCGGATALWLLLTTATEMDQLLLFGQWRIRHFLPAIAGTWLVAVLLIRWMSVRAGTGFLKISVFALIVLLLLEGIGLTGLVAYGELFHPKGAALGKEALPHLDVRGETFQDLALRWRRPSEPIEFHYRTDRRGYRNMEDRAEADIYLLGDSILVAGLLPLEDTVTGLLERKLGASVMNISLIGVGPPEERDMLLEAKLPLENRLVLHWVFEGNDLLDSGEALGDGAAAGGRFRRTFTFNLLLLLQRFTDAPDPSRNTGWIGEHEYLFSWLESSHRGLLDRLSNIEDALADTRRHVVASGGRHAVVYVPAKIRVLGPLCRWPDGSPLADLPAQLNPMREPFLKWCGDEGIPVLDLTQALRRSADSGQIPWFWGDTHPNEIGHRVMAEETARWEVVRQRAK